MHKKTTIIGAGTTGITSAHQLAQNGHQVLLLEKEETPFGNLKNWVKLFPDFTSADEIRNALSDKLAHENIELKTNFSVEKLYSENGKWFVENNEGEKYESDTVLLATGFTPFDARRKEELGYGIYQNVITSVEFEKMTQNNEIRTVQGTIPQRIAFLNCVGSRDEKVGNQYCSRLCCINAVKQAIEYKEVVLSGDAYIFYMDLRMSGQCYEELYRTSQQDFGVNYIRGRISEASGTIDNRVQIKAEDTLTGLPLKITVDMLVLMVGIEPSQSTKLLGKQNNIAGEYGFVQSLNPFLADNKTAQKGLFVAGTCKRPMSIPEVMADAKAVSQEILNEIK